jgi:uncharacterized cupredoxin-like copper-binding protein
MRLWTIALAFIASLAIVPVAAAAGPREHHGAWQQAPIVLSLRLGTEAGDLEIVPGTLTLQAGKPHKLVIINLSEVAHVLALPEFSATVAHSSAPAFPYKPGTIDVAAGETVEWYFVPTKAGHYKMGCAIRAHAEAGMHGEIVVN